MSELELLQNEIDKLFHTNIIIYNIFNYKLISDFKYG